MGSRYRCRVSPSGVPGCVPGTGGTGGTGEGLGEAGAAISLAGDPVLISTEPDNFVPVPSPSWFFRDSADFTDLGSGVIRYDGPERLFQLGANMSASSTSLNDTLSLSYFLNGSSLSGLVLGAVTTHAIGTIAHTSIDDSIRLLPGDELAIAVSNSSGEDFSVALAQLSLGASG